MATEVLTRQVVLNGITPVMFDRYAGDNQTTLPPDQKMYLASDGSRTVVLPALNLSSFLSAQNTPSAPKRLIPPRQYKTVAAGCLSFVEISPAEIPFTRDGKPILFGEFQNDRDALSGMRVTHHVARLKDGVPNPKVRPMLPTPWELAFTLTLYRNPDVNETQLRMLFTKGGIAIGIGTFRGLYGKFEVTKWT